MQIMITSCGVDMPSQTPGLEGRFLERTDYSEDLIEIGLFPIIQRVDKACMLLDAEASSNRLSITNLQLKQNIQLD